MDPTASMNRIVVKRDTLIQTPDVLCVIIRLKGDKRFDLWEDCQRSTPGKSSPIDTPIYTTLHKRQVCKSQMKLSMIMRLPARTVD